MIKPRHGLGRHRPRGAGLLIALLLLLTAAPGWGAKATKMEPVPPIAPAQKAVEEPRVYEVTEVIPRSERSMAHLRAILDKLDADTSIDLIETELSQFTQRLDEWWKAEGPALREGRSVQRVNDLAWELTARSAQIEAWKLLLVDSGKALIANSQALEREMAKWQSTRTALKTDAPPAVRERIDEVLRQIEALQRLLREKTGRLVAIQGQLAAQGDALNRIRKELDVVRLRSARGLFSHDSPPLWTVFRGEPTTQTPAAQAGAIWSKLRSQARSLIEAIRTDVVLHVAAFIGVLGLFLLLRRLSHQAGNIQPTAAEQVVLERSVFSALVLTLGFMPMLYSGLSPSLVRLLILPGLVPVLMLTPAIFAPQLRAGFYCFTALFLLDFLRNYLPLQWSLARLLLLSEAALGAIGLAIFLLQQRRLRAAEHRPPGILDSLIVVGLAACLGSATANVAGNLSLAEYMVSPLIRLLFFAVAIRLGVVVATTFAVMALRTPIALFSRLIQKRGEEVAVQLRRIIRVAGISFWVALALFNFGLLTSMQAGFWEFMKTEWRVGAAVISVHDFATFFLVMFATYIMSRALRLILAEEIFPRTDFPRGVPDALVLLARYGVLLGGFLLALSSAGVDLSKVTIALSALGVGIGFGLQNVVNNFVCGLILVFEHPIQAGDYIEVAPHYGQVTRIGFRACMLQTRDGSNVVIPNSELIGNKVVNWSLSSSIRRINIPISVAIGADTVRVIDLLQSVARGHPRVCIDPPPRAVREPFGDAGLKFVLYCWVPTEQMNAIRDELALAIDRAFHDAGVGMPFARADVHLHFPDGQSVRVEPPTTPKQG